MRVMYIVLYAVLIITALASATHRWEELECDPDYHFYAIDLPTEEIGYAVGYFHDFLRSDPVEYGVVLQLQYIEDEWGYADLSQNFDDGLDDERVMGVSFVSATSGWICTDGGSIWKTTNGGTDWTEQSLPERYTYGFEDISMFSTSDGWACGNVFGAKDYNGVAVQYSEGTWSVAHIFSDYQYRTVYTNGGETNVFLGRINGSDNTLRKRKLQGEVYVWETVNPITDTYSIQDIDFCEINPDLGWATGNAATFYTENGGSAYWTEHGEIYDNITCIEPASGEAMAWSTYNDDIYYTYDTGFGWSNWSWDATVDLSIQGLCSVRRQSGDVWVFAAAWEGSIYYLDVSSDNNPPVTIADLEEPVSLRVISVCRDAIVVDIDLPEAAEANLYIFDITGRLTTSSNLGGVRDGSGTYTINCGDSSGDCLPVGVYYCVLETETQMATASFVLID